MKNPAARDGRASSTWMRRWDKAIGIFREQGFHATSVGDLTGAMELTSGSIYKAFKDKRAVFLAAFDRYTTQRNEQFRQVAASGKTGFERVRNVLAFYVKSAQGTEGRRGCLVVGSAVEMAVCDPEIAVRVTTALKKNEAFPRGIDSTGPVRWFDLLGDRRGKHRARDGLPDLRVCAWSASRDARCRSRRPSSVSPSSCSDSPAQKPMLIFLTIRN